MTWRFWLSLPLGLLFLSSGIAHFAKTALFLKMMPPWLPAPHALVLLSGAVEIVFAVLLFIPKYSRVAAWGLFATLIAVFPANIHMYQTAGTAASPLPDLSPFWAAARLPFQLVLLAWAYALTRPKGPGAPTDLGV